MKLLKKLLRNIATSLAVVMIFNVLTVAAVSAETNKIGTISKYTDAQYDARLMAAYEGLAAEEYVQQKPQQFGAASIIGHLLKLIFKEAVKKGTAQTVKATTKNVITKVTKHALEEAIKDGITNKMVDNILSQKSSGMFAIQKFDDVAGISRVMVDPNNKVVVILSKYDNTIITVYKDTGDSIKNRVDSGRWVKGAWKFK